MDNNLVDLINLLKKEKKEKKEKKKINNSSNLTKLIKLLDKKNKKKESKKLSKYNNIFQKNKKEPKKIVVQNKHENKKKREKEGEKVVVQNKNKHENNKEPEKIVVQNKNENKNKKKLEKIVVQNKNKNENKNENKKENKNENKNENKKKPEKVIIKNESNSNNNLDGWVKYNVDGDGSCAFHSIMLYYEKTNQKDILDKKYGNSGNSLRNQITKNVEEHISLYKDLKNNSNTKKYINNIYKHPLVNINKSNIIKHMEESLEILKNHKTYTTNDELQIISAKLCKKIFVWNETEKKWLNISIPDKCTFKIEDSIFLYFNNNNYELLLPDKNYIFKSSYNNLSKEIMFNYIFLEKKKNS
jgi:hypothetical protein